MANSDLNKLFAICHLLFANHAEVAQVVEHSSEKAGVGSASLPLGTLHMRSGQAVNKKLILIFMIEYVYIIECADNSYYTGITANLSKRINEHNNGTGALFTRNRKPIKLVYWEKIEDKHKAASREREIKGWRREKKQNLINTFRKSLH